VIEARPAGKTGPTLSAKPAAIADTDLLRKSDESGDVFATPREVDFTFESAQRDNAEDFAEFVNRNQYGVAKVSELEDGRFRILVLITMPITQHLISSISGFMFHALSH
jgi:hypothetical protein